MKKQRMYSLFAKESDKWIRLSPLATTLADARKLFQGALLMGSLNGKNMALRPAEDDFDNKAEYDVNRARIFNN